MDQDLFRTSAFYYYYHNDSDSRCLDPEMVDRYLRDLTNNIAAGQAIRGVQLNPSVWSPDRTRPQGKSF